MTHYYHQKQDAPFKPAKMSATLRGIPMEFITAAAVFSPKKVDSGSRLLIEKAQINQEDTILDLGCGYGAVGVTLAKAFPRAKVTLTDVNERAVKLAMMNVKNMNVNATVLQGDGFEKIKKSFDVILFNPPQSAGRDLCNRLIQEAKAHLVKGGSLQVVARHNKGGKMFEAFMEGVFGNIETLAKQGGYRIYKATLQ